MMADPGNVLTLNDLATYLKISRSTLYKLLQRGDIPGVKVGRHWRFHRDTIDAWLKQGPMVERKGVGR
jgi:excisionase family DNA binding protein